MVVFRGDNQSAEEEDYNEEVEKNEGAVGR